MGIVDSMYINVARKLGRSFMVGGVVSFGICSKSGIEVPKFINRLIDGEGSGFPVNDRIGGLEPWEA